MRPPDNRGLRPSNHAVGIAHDGIHFALIAALAIVLLTGCHAPPKPPPEKTQTPPVQSFVPMAVFEGETEGGKKMFIRRTTALEKKAAPEKYVHAATISVSFKPDASGMPADENVHESLKKLEDMLISLLEDKERCALAGVVTTEGVRTFVFYTVDPEAVKNIVGNLQKLSPEHKMDLDIAVDKEWQFYKDLEPAETAKKLKDG